ncbi:MAG: hypothetical protein LBR60_01810 [Fibrobacter sp.]|jgi:hypothetical protein|nr:hypothetical protein [Fibrobacter sp.]
MDSSKHPTSALMQQFAVDFCQGKFDSLYEHVLPFLMKNIEDIYSFIESLGPNADGFDTLGLLKLYIYERSMPFDMNLYMKNQSDFIKDKINLDGKSKQEAVAEWIKEHAERHRDVVIKEQCLYLDKIADKIVPVIDAELKKLKEKKE